MDIKTTTDWLTWGALVLPLAIIAWSAIKYVGLEKERQRQKNFENFFTTVLRVHNSDRSLLSQKAAIFELRNYPQYRDLTLRVCDNFQDFFPNAPDTLQVEVTELADFLRK